MNSSIPDGPLAELAQVPQLARWNWVCAWDRGDQTFLPRLAPAHASTVAIAAQPWFGQIGGRIAEQCREGNGGAQRVPWRARHDARYLGELQTARVCFRAYPHADISSTWAIIPGADFGVSICVARRHGRLLSFAQQRHHPWCATGPYPPESGARAGITLRGTVFPSSEAGAPGAPRNMFLHRL
jgi:hypothetical protein